MWLRACYAEHVVAPKRTRSCCLGDGLTSRKKDITELFLSLHLHLYQQQQQQCRLIKGMFHGYQKNGFSFFFFLLRLTSISFFIHCCTGANGLFLTEYNQSWTTVCIYHCASLSVVIVNVFCDVFLVDNQKGNKGAVNHDRLFKQENFQRLFTSAAFWLCSFSLPTFFYFEW